MLKDKFVAMWISPILLNALAAGFASAALVIAGAAGVYWVKRHSVFTVKEVVVTGMRGEQDVSHQNPAFIKQAIVSQLSGNLMTVKLDAVQSTFAQAPWIRHVQVRRVWPNRLWVVLEEHQAVATLNDDYLVNQQGEAYMAVADGTLGELPVLMGNRQDAALMLARFRELNSWLAPSKLTVTQLFFSERRAWTAVLSNRMTLDIGRDDLKPATEQRVAQWAKTWTYAQQATGAAASLHIDLRYPNGYAVRRVAS